MLKILHSAKKAKVLKKRLFKKFCYFTMSNVDLNSRNLQKKDPKTMPKNERVVAIIFGSFYYFFYDKYIVKLNKSRL